MVSGIHIMGIVNLTPDSFYSGSRVSADAALQRIQAMFSEGADVVDLGACSTRPGSQPASEEEEWARLEPVLHALMGFSRPSGPRNDRIPVIPGPGPDRASHVDQGPSPVIPSEAHLVIPSVASVSPAFSIDTFRPEIVRRAYELIGPFMVNDVGGGEDEMLRTVGQLGLPYVAMHGRPFTGDVVEDVIAFFRDFAKKAQAFGVNDWLLDPGFGFNKTLEQNYTLLGHLKEVKDSFPREVLVGLSRKSMAYQLLGISPEEALPATQVLHTLALERGADWLRVHDVAAAVQTVRICTKCSY